MYRVAPCVCVCGVRCVGWYNPAGSTAMHSVHLVTLWKTVRTYKRMDLYVPCELFYGTLYNDVLGLF